MFHQQRLPPSNPSPPFSALPDTHSLTHAQFFTHKARFTGMFFDGGLINCLAFFSFRLWSDDNLSVERHKNHHLVHFVLLIHIAAKHWTCVGLLHPFSFLFASRLSLWPTRSLRLAAFSLPLTCHSTVSVTRLRSCRLIAIDFLNSLSLLSLSGHLTYFSQCECLFSYFFVVVFASRSCVCQPHLLIDMANLMYSIYGIYCFFLLLLPVLGLSNLLHKQTFGLLFGLFFQVWIFSAVNCTLCPDTLEFSNDVCVCAFVLNCRPWPIFCSSSPFHWLVFAFLCSFFNVDFLVCWLISFVCSARRPLFSPFAYFFLPFFQFRISSRPTERLGSTWRAGGRSVVCVLVQLITHFLVSNQIFFLFYNLLLSFLKCVSHFENNFILNFRDRKLVRFCGTHPLLWCSFSSPKSDGISFLSSQSRKSFALSGSRHRPVCHCPCHHFRSLRFASLPFVSFCRFFIFSLSCRFRSSLLVWVCGKGG